MSVSTTRNDHRFGPLTKRFSNFAKLLANSWQILNFFPVDSHELQLVIGVLKSTTKVRHLVNPGHRFHNSHKHLLMPTLAALEAFARPPTFMHEDQIYHFTTLHN